MEAKGFLPDWTNETEVRAFAGSALKLPEILAGLTPTPIDDQVVELLTTIVATDATWDKVWALFQRKLAAVGPGKFDWKVFLAAIVEAILKIFG